MLKVKARAFPCPKCDGSVEPVKLSIFSFRWTCQKCGRDYGYNTSKPTFAGGYHFLTTEEVYKFLKEA